MNIFNRILIVLSLLVLMAALTAICIAPGIILPTAGQWLVDWGNYLGRNDILDPSLRLIVGILIAAVIDMALLLFIFFEVIPRRKRYIDVQMIDGGNATVSLSSVEEQLQYSLDTLPGVVWVKIKSRAKGKHVAIKAQVAISRQAHVTQTADRLVNTIQNVITNDMGLKLAGKPEVRLEIIDPPVVTPKPESQRSSAPATAITSPEVVSTTQTLPPALPEPVAKSEHDPDLLSTFDEES